MTVDHPVIPMVRIPSSGVRSVSTRPGSFVLDRHNESYSPPFGSRHAHTCRVRRSMEEYEFAARWRSNGPLQLT
jgi:hypothetical protein